MAPSASKQKRLAEKAAKQASKTGSTTGTSTPGVSTPSGSTPMTSANGSSADLVEDAKAEMAKLNLKQDRSAVSLLFQRSRSNEPYEACAEAL
jgi:ATP-binding cassette subfamily F protein 2